MELSIHKEDGTPLRSRLPDEWMAAAFTPHAGLDVKA
mgnify:CR=1 FL=1